MWITNINVKYKLIKYWRKKNGRKIFMTWPTEFLSDKKQQTGRDYLQITYLTKELYMEYILKTLNTQKEENKTLIDKNM